CTFATTLSFLHATATPEIYTLSLHDALPIFDRRFHVLRAPRHHAGTPTTRRLRSRNEERVLPAFRRCDGGDAAAPRDPVPCGGRDRKSTRLNSSHVAISYAVFCLKKKRQYNQ